MIKQNGYGVIKMDIETFGQIVSFLAMNNMDPITLKKRNSMIAVSPELAGRVIAVSSEWVDMINPLFTKLEAMVNPNLNIPYDPEGGHRWWVVPEGQRDWSFYLPVGTTDFYIENLNRVWKVPAYFDKAVFRKCNIQEDRVSLAAILRLINAKGSVFDTKVYLDYLLVNPPKLIKETVRDYSYVGYMQTITLKNIGNEIWDENHGMIGAWSLNMLKSGEGTWIVLPVEQGTIDQVVDYKMSGPNKDSEVDSSRFLKRDNYGLLRADGRYKSKMGLRPNIATRNIASIDLNNGLLTIMNVSLITAGKRIDNRWVPEERFNGTIIDCYNDSGDIAGNGPVSMFELEGVSPVRVQKPGERNVFGVSVRYFKTDPSNIGILYDILNKTVGVDLRKETYKT